MKETYYFSHDYNSRSDSKIKRLLLKHGMLGYGIWWAIIEDLYSNDNSLLLDYESIAFDLHTDIETIKSVINDFDLFIISGKSFGSNSVQMRIEIRNEKSAKARESVKARWDKIKKPKDIASPENHKTENTFKTHFDSVLAFFSEPYELKLTPYKEQFTKQEYDRFALTIKKIVEAYPQLETKFEKCMSIGDWKKHLNCKGFALLKPAIELMLGYEIKPGSEMVFKIKQFMDKEDNTILKTKS